MSQRLHQSLRKLRYFAKLVAPIWSMFNQLLRTVVLLAGLLAHPSTNSSIPPDRLPDVALGQR
jgi:hypothetical protein